MPALGRKQQDAIPKAVVAVELFSAVNKKMAFTGAGLLTDLSKSSIRVGETDLGD